MKLMPSASELREMCSLDDFIEKIITLVRSEASHGETRYIVDIPIKHSMEDTKKKLTEAFPDCRITRSWLTRFYTISWA
jgi:hypothetical protein